MSDPVVLTSWIWPVALAPFIGSFVGTVVTRVERPRDILWGRSRCASCGHALAPRDLVPFLSWIQARGRCRYCGDRIAAFYPAIELAALGIALWSVMVASGWVTWATALLGWLLLALAIIDFEHYLLPDFLTLPLVAIGLAINGAGGLDADLPYAIGAAAGYLFVVALRRAYWLLRGREGIGLGDAKLLAAAGAWIGWEGLPSVILIAALSGLAVALLWRWRGRDVALTDRIPFGTCLCLGIWLVWLYGPLA